MAANSTNNNAAATKARLNTTDEFDSKIVLLGDSGVGKTSIAVRYVQESFSSKLPPTIGASFLTKRIAVDNFKIKLQLWDTAGQERFRSLAPMYYRGAVAAILVFDLTNETSFNKVKDWVTELRTNVSEEIIMCIVGNKADLDAQRKITADQGSEYAASIGATYYETSAKTNTGVDSIFLDIAKKLKLLYGKNPPKPPTGGALYHAIQNDRAGDGAPPPSTGCSC